MRSYCDNGSKLKYSGFVSIVYTQFFSIPVHSKDANLRGGHRKNTHTHTIYVHCWRPHVPLLKYRCFFTPFTFARAVRTRTHISKYICSIHRLVYKFDRQRIRSFVAIVRSIRSFNAFICLATTNQVTNISLFKGQHDHLSMCTVVCKAASSTSYHFLLNARFIATVGGADGGAITIRWCCAVVVAGCRWLCALYLVRELLFFLGYRIHFAVVLHSVSFILLIYPGEWCSQLNGDIYYLETWTQERWPRIHSSSITFDSIQSIIMQSHS